MGVWEDGAAIIQPGTFFAVEHNQAFCSVEALMFGGYYNMNRSNDLGSFFRRRY